MEKKHFDRNKIKYFPLAECNNQISIGSEKVKPTDKPDDLSAETMFAIRQTALDIVEAKRKNASRILTFGTNVIRNGLGPLVGEFVRQGWLTHLATTGTSIVDDWEFAYQGAACEDTRVNMPNGTFGKRKETNYYINLAILIGAWQGLGLGESVSKMIAKNSLTVPDRDILTREIINGDNPDKISAAADLLDKIEKYDISPGRIDIPHPFRNDSLLYIAQETNIPFTVHPMFGLDILFMHPINSYAAVGRTAESDFLYFAKSIYNMEDGVYISIGSSIASPMIYEKALSMSQNIRIPKGIRMERHKIVVVDLAESKWDWMHNGEPPEDRPEYYLRYCKSFSRAKAKSMYYISSKDSDFLLHLYKELEIIENKD